MATVAAGLSQTITASGNQAVETNLGGGSSGYVTVNGARSDLSTGSRTFKLSDGDVLVVTCYVGIITYSVSGSGVGTERGGSTAKIASLMRTPLAASVLGNSFSTPNVPGNTNWFFEMCGASDGLLRPDVVAGVTGNTTAQMLARVTSIPATTGVCFVQEGSNDAAAGVTPQVHAANLRSICTALLNQGTLPIVVLSPPRDTYVATLAKYRIVEWWLARKLGIPVLDIWGSFFDTTTGNWLAGASTDGTHPTDATYQAGGRAAVSQLRNGAITLLSPRATAWGDLVTNNLFINNSSGLATGWNALAGPGVQSIESAAGDGYLGNWQTSTVTGGAAGTLGGFSTDGSVPTGTLPTDVFVVSVNLKATVTSNSKTTFVVRWTTAASGGGSSIREDSFVYANANSIAPRTWSQELTPPANALGFKIMAYVNNVAASSYSGSVSLNSPLLANVSNLAGF